MPKLESNLLYGPAQQTKPWRAGTPGRAPRYRRAVVDNRRPLCLFLLFLIAVTLPATTHAQQLPDRKVAIQLRAGVSLFSSLVEDDMASQAVQDAIPGQSTRVTLRQQVAPTIGLGALWPLGERTSLEANAAFASSTLRGEDDFETWDAATVSLVNALIGVSYAYRGNVRGHAGVGLTKLFGDEDGIFRNGSGTHPLLEAGVSVVTPIHPALQFDVRGQTHRFITGSLQNEGAAEGNVWRLVITASYRIMGGAQ